MSKKKIEQPESEGFQKLTERVNAVYSSALEQAGGVAREATSTIEANVTAAIVGGIALGAIVGALLPRSEGERKLLEPLGGKVGDAARAALDAARAAGADALNESGLGSTDAIRDQAQRLFSEAVKAAGAAGAAALGSARASVASE